MIETTLIYLKRDNKYLMLHRTKKENDINENKWLGIGGKLELNETPDKCIKREVKEETGKKKEEEKKKGWWSGAVLSPKMKISRKIDINKRKKV